MKIRKEQILCSVGDDYDKISYDYNTPCRQNGKLFLLRDAKKESTGDFEMYSHGSWLGAVCVASGNPHVRESLAVHFNFPRGKYYKQPTTEQVEVVRKAVEEALEADEFKNKVKDTLANTDVSVVGRSNVYYGDW